MMAWFKRKWSEWRLKRKFRKIARKDPFIYK